MGTFALQVRRFAETTREKADAAVRAVAIQMLARIVQRSPVGNPELWAANAEAITSREQHNYRVQIAADFGAARGKKMPRNLRRRSARALTKLYPLSAGKGYVGGRFRGNWQITLGTPAAGAISDIDPGGANTIAKGTSALSAFKAGVPIFIMNNLPYGPRLEYEGWSKQAPAGMVRITVAEFRSIVSEEARAPG